jgi:mono/diheme cytochrome c family protein
MLQGRPVRTAAACTAAIAVALLLGGCGGDGPRAVTTHTTRTTAVDPAVQARMMRVGRRVFAQHCQACHALLGKPNLRPHPDAPPYDLDEVKVEAGNIRERVLIGGPGMGGFTYDLSATELRSIVAYVAAVDGRNVTPPTDVEPDRLAAGEQVFRDHCQRCHAIAGRPPTHPPWWVGIDFDKVQPSERRVAKKVREGQWEHAMPAFRHTLTRDQIAAVAAYVAATARPGRQPR